MAQLSRTAPRNQGKPRRPSLAFFYVEVFVGILLCGAFVSGVYFALETAFPLRSQRTPAIAYAAQLERHAHVNLSVVINQQGLHKDWPAYAPSTVVVPANSLVTVTIRNYDLGDTSLPKGSPFTTVQGMVGGVAYADGHAYSALAPEKVAHTFTFRTGAAGSYYYRCFDPCGTGAIGWQGPMVTRGYMLGTLTVQA
jgi:hypothetical protein